MEEKTTELTTWHALLEVESDYFKVQQNTHNGTSKQKVTKEDNHHARKMLILGLPVEIRNYIIQCILVLKC